MRPRDLAVLKLIANSNFVGCSAGMSVRLATFFGLNDVVALFMGRATMMLFFRRLLIWDFST